MHKTEILLQVCYEVAIVDTLLHQVADVQFPDCPIDYSRRRMLRMMQDRGPMTVSDLARERAVSRQYMRALVKELVDSGLVEFCQNPKNARSPLVHLTEQGQAFTSEHRQRVLVEMDKITSGLLGEDDLTATLRTLQVMRRIASDLLLDK